MPGEKSNRSWLTGRFDKKTKNKRRRSQSAAERKEWLTSPVADQVIKNAGKPIRIGSLFKANNEGVNNDG